MCLRWEKAGRERGGRSSSVFYLLSGWEGQPQFAILGKHAYQECGRQVPGEAIYLSPTSGGETLFMETGGGVLEQGGLPTLKGAQTRKGNTT